MDKGDYLNESSFQKTPAKTISGNYQKNNKRLQYLKCNVIVCGPATGKTYLAQHDSHFVDIDAMKADYKYDLYNVALREKERTKLNRGKVVKKDSSKYAINLLKKTIQNDKIALLSYNQKVIDYIISKNINYCLIYTKKNSRNEYKKRMQQRGNQDLFIDQMTNQLSWDKFYEENINNKTATYKIELQKGEYLSDIKDIFLPKRR